MLKKKVFYTFFVLFWRKKLKKTFIIENSNKKNLNFFSLEKIIIFLILKRIKKLTKNFFIDIRTYIFFYVVWLNVDEKIEQFF